MSVYFVFERDRLAPKQGAISILGTFVTHVADFDDKIGLGPAAVADAIKVSEMKKHQAARA